MARGDRWGLSRRTWGWDGGPAFRGGGGSGEDGRRAAGLAVRTPMGPEPRRPGPGAARLPDPVGRRHRRGPRHQHGPRPRRGGGQGRRDARGASGSHPRGGWDDHHVLGGRRRRPIVWEGFRGLGKALGRAPALRCRGSPGRSAGGSGRDREPGSGFGWRQDHRGRVRPRALGFRAVPPGQAGPGGRRGTGPGSRRGGDASDDPDAGSKGRASYPGPRSVGHQDPGASTALLFSALERAAGGLDRPSRERP